MRTRCGAIDKSWTVRRAPRGRARSGTARGNGVRHGSAATSATMSRRRCRPARRARPACRATPRRGARRTDDPAADDDHVPGVEARVCEIARRGVRAARRSVRGRLDAAVIARPSRRDARSARAASPVPTMSTGIASGVWKTTSWNVGGQEAGQDRRAEDDRDDHRATSDDLAPARLATAWPRSATVGLGRDADRRDQDLARVGGAAFGEQAGLGPVERDGQVGADRRIGRLAAREVDRRRGVDRDDGDARRRGPCR